MKKLSFKLVALSLMLMPSLGVNAQNVLGDILGGIANASGVTATTNGSDLISNLTSVFSSSKQASTNGLVGTWEYAEPAIVFESDNFLTNAGAKLVSVKLEKNIQNHLTKYGIKQGALKFTFKEDGTFVELLGKKTMQGTWKVEDSKLLLTYGGIKTVTVTTQLDGKNLMFVTDATKILEMFKSFGSRSTNTNLKAITALMKSVKGMKAGLTLEKK